MPRQFQEQCAFLHVTLVDTYSICLLDAPEVFTCTLYLEHSGNMTQMRPCLEYFSSLKGIFLFSVRDLL